VAGLLQVHRVLRPVPARGRAAVARAVTGAGILDPQVGVDSRRARVEPGRKFGAGQNTQTSVTADGFDPERYRAAGTAPVLEIIAALDPFHEREKKWSDLRSQLWPRITTAVIEDASHALFPDQGMAVFPDQGMAVASAVLGYLKTLTSR